MLGRRSGKEKEGDLGALLFSLHFSIASAAFFFFFLSSPKGETEQKKNINRFSRHKYYRRGALSERGKQEGLGYSLHPSTHPLFCLLSPPDSLSLRHPTVTQGAELMFALVPQQGTKELYHS